MEAHESLGLDGTTPARDSSTPPGEGGDRPASSLRVRVEESWFVADRALLAAHSDFFRALFRWETAGDGRPDELRLRGGVSARGFLVMLAVCRGEPVSLRDPEELWDAVECAAFLQTEVLTQCLCDLVDSDTCLELYAAAHVFGVRQLFCAAALHLCDAREDLWEDALAALPEELLAHARSLSPASFVAVGTHTPTAAGTRDSSFRAVLRLDEEGEGEWRHLTHLPALCSTALAGVAVLHDRLYVVGGVHGYNKETLDGGFCYDPGADAWSTVPGPTEPRCDFTLLGHQGRLYAVGGRRLAGGETTAAAEAFDVASGAWSPVRSAPRPVGSAACASARRRMFVCFWRPPDATDVYEYASGEDAWTLLTTLRRPQSYGHCMVGHGSRLYVMRNGPGDDFLRCVMDRYDLATGQWSALPGFYVNSKGALFTARVRGDSVLTVKSMLTLVYRVTERDGWRPRRQMSGFPEKGGLTAMEKAPCGCSQPTVGAPVGQQEVCEQALLDRGVPTQVLLVQNHQESVELCQDLVQH
ncbi:hypothetical protein NHX12_025557 [Muraenolepis orangiensis]|uniref:BTB domain-containing protein n=1 Tax=Muraenolepis orangiensis TaxID=630683 RepID=A0A9Q0EMZ2_9TELE|nr:hypothetical protein NHX12_025557 [Muraenolepis orangiensis]